MLELGASKPWKEVIEVMTGKPQMSTDAFREYFAPLESWLKEENARNGVKVGWDVPDYGKYCKSNKVAAAGAGSLSSSLAALGVGVMVLAKLA